MKALSRLASPAGFALVLLLFLLLPFLSVSCEVPGMGSLGADYTGTQLAVGDEPEVEVPEGLQEMAEELPGGSVEGSEPPPDPDVQVLAIIAAIVMAAGIATALIPRVRTRLVGGAGIAVLAGVLLVVTQVVAQSNLVSQLRADAEDLSDGATSVPDIDTVADEMIHTEVGFWLSVVGLALIALISVGVVFKDRLVPKPAGAVAAGAITGPPPEGAFTAEGAPPPAGTNPAYAPPPGPAPGDALAGEAPPAAEPPATEPPAAKPTGAESATTDTNITEPNTDEPNSGGPTR